MPTLEVLQPFMPPFPACMLDDEGGRDVSSGIVCEGSNAGTTRRGARAAAAAASQPGRIPRSAIVAILAAVRRSTPVRVVPVN